MAKLKLERDIEARLKQGTVITGLINSSLFTRALRAITKLKEDRDYWKSQYELLKVSSSMKRERRG